MYHCFLIHSSAGGHLGCFHDSLEKTLMLGCYCGGCLNSILQASFTFTLPFCSSNHIDHFFCDVPPLLKLACADTTTNELVMFEIGRAHV